VQGKYRYVQAKMMIQKRKRDREIFVSNRQIMEEKLGGKYVKIPIHAGFTCPNRDGTKALGGCYYCNNAAFSPWYCSGNLDIDAQIEKGIRYYRNKISAVKHFVGYFQTYSNTYNSIENLERLFRRVLMKEELSGILISTRPDCLDAEKVDLLEKLSREKYTGVEIGIESFNNQVLRNINRHHDVECSMNAIRMLQEKKIHFGAHFILGLPGEKWSDLPEYGSIISRLQIPYIKLHQLQIVKGTVFEKQFRENPEMFDFLSVEEYMKWIIRILENLSMEVAIDRFMGEIPSEYLIAPHWGGIRHNHFLHALRNRMQESNTWQGKNMG
jgi:uncharacterized protein